MTDQSSKTPETFSEVMDMPLEEHAEIMKRYLTKLSTKGIGGFFLLTNEDRAIGSVIGANRAAIARFICDLMQDDGIFAMTHEELIERRLHPKMERYDA